ncbi:MAG: DUF1810 domain-containing protein [Candidatus Electrothrix sp. YB6]
MDSRDPFDLQRFVRAQNSVWRQVVRELRQGRKQTHWMWFVFPQVQGLGRSAVAEQYAIRSMEEAEAYLAHTVLGSRLQECVQLTLAVKGRSAGELFGYPDELKFRSCLTLFRETVGENSLFTHALDRYFSGRGDWLTVDIIKRWRNRV